MMGNAQNNSIHKIGFWFALAAFIASTGCDTVQLMQVFGAIKFPLDDITTYAFTLRIPVPFVIAMVV